jgi:hypothetical protein
MRAHSTIRLLCGVATTVLAVACGARSPLEPSDGGSGGGFEPDALVAADGDQPSHASPPGLPGAYFRDASVCYECETDSSGPPVPVQPIGGGSSESVGPVGGCTTFVEATRDGGSYQGLCACPEGACTCFGRTTKVVPFMGCPSSCPTGTEIASLCGWSLN